MARFAIGQRLRPFPLGSDKDDLVTIVDIVAVWSDQHHCCINQFELSTGEIIPGWQIGDARYCTDRQKYKAV